MNAQTQIPYAGEFTSYGAEQIHDAMDLDSLTVRRWRNRGYFSGGEKCGKSYLYNVEDIAKLVILREMNDVGVKMSTAASAANLGASLLCAHALLNAPLLEAWGSSDEEVDAIVKAIQCDTETLSAFFNANDTDFLSPFNYMITGGDDFDDWNAIDDLSQVDQLEQYNLVYIFTDLRKLAERLVIVLREFGNGVGEPLRDDEELGPVAAFWAEGCTDKGKHQRFSPAICAWATACDPANLN